MLLSGFWAQAQSPNWKWAKRAGSNNMEQPLGLGVDRNGNTYEAGQFNSSSVTFGSFTLINTMGSTARRNYLLKRDVSGNVLWAKALPMDYSNHSFHINKQYTADDGSTYLWGDFSNTIVVLGDTILPPPVGFSSYVMKVNPSGNLVWFKKNNNQSVYSRVQRLGNRILLSVSTLPFLADTFGTITFSPGHSLMVMDTSGNYTNALKLIDRRDFSDYCDFKDLAVNNRGHIFVLTYGTDSTLYKPLAWPAHSVAGREVQGQVAMFDSNLVCQWVKSYALDSLTSLAVSGEAMFIDADDFDNAWVYGNLSYGKLRYNNTLPTPASPYSNQSVFWMKLKPDGSVAKLKSYNKALISAIAEDMLVDRIGNAYLLGRFSGGITYDTVHVSSTSNNAYIAKADADMNMQWAKITSGNSVLYPIMALEDGRGNVFMNGSFYGTMIVGNDTLVCASPIPANPTAGDNFILKLGSCNPAIPTISAQRPLQWCGNDSVVLSASTSKKYLWNTGDTTSTLISRGNGVFEVYSMDSLGCYAVSAPTVTLAHPAPVLNSTSTAVNCFGGNDGTITNAVSNGTPGYQMSSTPPVTNFLHVEAGQYFLQVSDTNGCVARDTVIVMQPYALTTSMDSVASTSSPANGKAIVTASGGNAPYLYSWNSNPQQHSDTATQLYGGWYVVTVTDQHGCDVVDSVFVRSYNGLKEMEDVNFYICQNPNDGNFEVVLRGWNGEATFEILDETGKLWQHGTWRQGINTIHGNLPAGVYELQLHCGKAPIGKRLVIMK